MPNILKYLGNAEKNNEGPQEAKLQVLKNHFLEYSTGRK